MLCKICFRLLNQQCTTSINLKIRNFNDNPYTIIPLPACDDADEMCSTSVYGSDQVDQSRTSMAMLDLVLSTYPGTISDVTVDREFSDHCLVSFNISSTPVTQVIHPEKSTSITKPTFTNLEPTCVHSSRRFSTHNQNFCQ